MTVHLVDGSALAGTIDRVGADFLEVSDRTGEAAGARPPAVRTVATAAVGVIRAAG